MAGQVADAPRSASVSVRPTAPAAQFTVAVFAPVGPALPCRTSAASLDNVPVVATSYRSVIPVGGVHVAEAVPQAAVWCVTTSSFARVVVILGASWLHGDPHAAVPCASSTSIGL